MTKGRLLSVILILATIGLIAIGTLWPNASALALAGGRTLHGAATTPEGAVTELAQAIGRQDWQRAYGSLANKAELNQQDLIRDLTGSHPSLRTYATLDHFDVRPLRSSANDALVQLRMHWSTVVGTFVDERELPVEKAGGQWKPVWPLVKEERVPPQVIAVNYLRWDVIYRGAGDDWGAQDVESPHIRIVDMHPVERSDGIALVGELLNEDVVPAYVNVKATLQGRNGAPLATEGSFDRISHLLLPKQVTPFLIFFRNVDLSKVGSVRMDPLSELVAASADPVIEIQNEHLASAPDAAVSGQLVNQSGQIVNIAHVLGTFYGKSGQPVWVADQYIDRALLPQTPVPFNIPVPQDLARKVSTERTVVSTYVAGGLQ